MPRPPLITRRTWWFAPYAAVALAHVVLLALNAPASAATKIALMPLLALPVVIAVVRDRLRPRAAVAALLTALLFSWLGDSAGAFFPTAPEIPLMLGFFGIAHLAYITLFVRHLSTRRMPRWAAVYAAWWIGMLATLGPHTGGLLIAVAAYGLVLAGTAAFSARCDRMIAIGGAVFLASDTVLAFRLFAPGGLPEWSNPVIMLTYTLGQGLIVAGALRVLQRRSIHA